MKLKIVLIIAALFCFALLATAQTSIIVKQNIVREIEAYDVKVVPSAKLEALAQELLAAYEVKGDQKDVDKVYNVRKHNWAYTFGVERFGGTATVEKSALDAIESGESFIHDETVKQASVAVATNGTGYIILIASY